MADFIFDEDELRAFANSIKTVSSELNNVVEEYVETMNAISSIGFASGEVSEALKAYVGYAEVLKGGLNTIASFVSAQTLRFISDVSDADNFKF